MTSLFILLTKGGLGGGNAGGGLFLILILLGLFILFGYILTHAAGGTPFTCGMKEIKFIL